MEELKECPKCKKIKNINNDFHYNPLRKRFYFACKECRSQSGKINNYKRKLIKIGLLQKPLSPIEIDLKNNNKQCFTCKMVKTLDNFTFLKKKNRFYCNCKKCYNEYKKIHRKQPHIIKQRQLYGKIYGKIYSKKNSEILKIKRKKYNQKLEVKIRRNKQKRIKYLFCPIFKLNHIMTVYLGEALENKNNQKWQSLVGYSTQDLKNHLESQFLPGMTWENHGKNYGKWNIDHIVPKSYFKYQSEKDADFKKCWSLKNLRPLWWEDNIKKFNHLTKDSIKILPIL